MSGVEVVRPTRLSVAQLEDTAGKASEKVVAEEFLRLGAAQVRAAQVQVQDMSMMDDLWLEEMKDTDSQTASLVIQATSFNRWAVIEQDLATSAEILRPPSSLVDMEERAKFAEVLRAQFQLHLLVLSKMFRSLHGGRNAVRLQQVLASKARRLARLLLPDLILLSARDLNRERLGSAPKTSSLSMRVLSSPLLAEPRMQRAMERCRALEDLELSYGSNLAEFEYLVICLWLPLYDEEKIALPLPVKEVYAVDLQ
ncbi:MCA1, partial [Symbiodinium sp. KB8]